MKKITLSLACLLGSFGLLQAQSFQNHEAPTESPVTIESLLDRINEIGASYGDVNEHFTAFEQRMLFVHFNGLERLAPQVITQSNSQTIEPGQGIACASHPTSFRNNNFYRDFDLAGDYGITDGFEVTAVEFAIDAISTPSGFPITINIYSATPGTFPGGSLTLEGSEVYTATNADALTIVNVPVSAIIPAGQSMVVEMVIVDDGTDTNYMTMGVNSAGETGPSYIMAPDCGAGVPMKFSDLGLTVGMVWNVHGDDEVGGGGEGGAIYAINNQISSLITFEVEDPDGFTVVNSSPAIDFENAGSVDPNNNTVAYVLDSAGNFFEVELASGTYTNLGFIAPPGGQTWTGAEFHPETGELYAVSTNIMQSSLARIDIDGLSSTVIGGLSGIEAAINLMIDDEGNAYTVCIVTDAFWSIDLDTAATSMIGSLGFDANFGQGGSWLADDPGFVYLSAFNSGNFSSEWRRLDVSTGLSTVIGMFNGGLDQVAWSSQVPEDTVGFENAEAIGFNFYPNPANNVITVNAKENIEALGIYNILGQRVLYTQVEATSKDLDITSLQGGVYIMKVVINGEVGTFKFVKK
jgi:hypothetical protein